MSAHAVTGAVTGSTGRALQRFAAQPGPERRRTPLSVVPAAPARSRVPFAVFSMVALIAALLVVLMLNISVSSRQYELVSLRGQEVALAEQNQALTQRLEHLKAPQNLATAAHELDMVASPTFGTIDVDSLTVTGSPEPAKESDAPQVLVPAPAVSIPNEAVSPVAAGESAADASRPAADPPASASSEADAPVAAGEGTPDEAGTPADPPASSKPTNGGTIPAPTQGASGQ